MVQPSTRTDYETRSELAVCTCVLAHPMGGLVALKSYVISSLGGRWVPTIYIGDGEQTQLKISHIGKSSRFFCYCGV
jgi:hypothetical protein